MKNDYIRGVVEGFYGKPWGWQERKDIISTMSGQYDLYIYAPKEDKYHRDLWREPYSEDFMAIFEDLVNHGKKKDIEVSLALSPGLSLIHSDEKDLNIVCDKFMRFADRGVTTFCLFFDDIPEDLVHQADKDYFSTLAEAQSFFTNAVYKRLVNKIDNFKFIMCPTLYFGTESNAYHHELGEKVIEGIEIMWTGPKVCSEKLETGNAKMISSAFKRPILYWDNYPVNDSAMVPELHIGPYEGRDGDLYKHSSGIILNPMSWAYASIISILNAEDYFEEREQFDAVASWKASIQKLAPECYKEFIEFAQANLKSPICSEPDLLTSNILKKYNDLYDQRKRKEGAEYLIEQGEHIEANAEIINNNLESKLLGDIQVWLDEYGYWGRVMKLTGQVLLADLSMYREDVSAKNLDDVTVKNELLEKSLKEAMSFNTTVLGNDILTFAFDRLRISKGLVSLYRY